MKETTRENIIALNSKINESLADEKYCDVTIKVGEKSFQCHRLILGSASEYFDAMFRGNFKESKSAEIELKEIEATTFEEVVQFIYTGDVVVTEFNVLNLIRTSEFYNLPNLRKLVCQFIKEIIEVDLVITDALEIFAFIYGTTHDDVLESLSAYIRKHLSYFLNTPSFLNIRFAELKTILKQSAPSENENEGVQAIIRWVQQSNHSKDAKGKFLNDLLEEIDYRNISPEYTKFIVKQCVGEYVSTKSEYNMSTEDDDKNGSVLTAESLIDSGVSKMCMIDLSMPQSLYVYVETPEKVTNVFTLQKCTSGFEWMFLCKAKNTADVMRITSLDNQLYCLNYHKPQDLLSSIQTFSVSSSISLFDKLYLNAPPLVVNRFDLRGMNNHLYMYNKDIFSEAVRGTEDSEFDDEAISRGVYQYNCEINKWMSLPPLEQKLANACMTCDTEKGLVYLIGGINPTRQNLHGYAQAYDPRCATWMALASSEDLYENGVCCFNNNFKEGLMVIGSHERPRKPECYNPVAGKWSRADGIMNSDTNSCRLISFEESEWAFGENVSDSSSVEVYRLNDSGNYSWSNVSSLSVAVEKNRSERPEKTERYDQVSGKWSRAHVEMNADGNICPSIVPVFEESESAIMLSPCVLSPIVKRRNVQIAQLRAFLGPSSVSIVLDSVTFKPYGL